MNFSAALSPGSLFGLATFSHKIGLYDVQGPIPVVKNVFIPPDAESSLPLELGDAMPLLQFLAPVWSFMVNVGITWLGTHADKLSSLSLLPAGRNVQGSYCCCS